MANNICQLLHPKKYSSAISYTNMSPTEASTADFRKARKKHQLPQMIASTIYQSKLDHVKEADPAD